MALCSSPRLAFTEVFVLVGGVILAMTIYIICTFLYYSRQEPASRILKLKKPTKFLRNSALIYFLFIIIALSLEIVTIYHLCTRGQEDTELTNFINFVLAMGSHVGLLIWYLIIYRLLITHSIFRISKCKHITFSILFISFIILRFTMIFAESRGYDSIYLILLAFWALIYFIELIFISIIFLRKICKIYGHKYDPDQYNKEESNNNQSIDYQEILEKHQKLITKITRITVLFFISQAISMTALTIVLMLDIDHDLYQEFMNHFIILFDTFKNFIFVILAYPFYDKYYKKLCGCLHLRCMGFIYRYKNCCDMCCNICQCDKERILKHESVTSTTKADDTEEKDNMGHYGQTSSTNSFPPSSGRSSKRISQKNAMKAIPSHSNKTSKSITIKSNHNQQSHHNQRSLNSVPDDTVTKTNVTHYKLTMTGNETDGGQDFLRTNSLVTPVCESDAEDDIEILVADDHHNINNLSDISGNIKYQTGVYKYKMSVDGSENNFNLKSNQSDEESKNIYDDGNGSGSDKSYNNNLSPRKFSDINTTITPQHSGRNSNNYYNHHNNMNITPITIMAEDFSGDDANHIGIGTQTRQMEEILDNILNDYPENDDNDTIRHSQYSKHLSTANNTDNENENNDDRELSEVP